MTSTGTNQAPKTSAQDPFKWRAIGLLTMFALTLPMTIGVIVLTLPAKPAPAWVGEAAALGVDPLHIALGEVTFKSNCALCHGKDAQGVARLGKPLRNSEFVQSHTDDELFSLITQGRPPTDPENTTGALMPPRAGKQLPDERLVQVVTYLRAIQDPDEQTVSIEDWLLKTGGGDSDQQLAGLVSGEGGIGHDLFISSCSACHGPDGHGLEGLGKPLDTSQFVATKSDDELIGFVKQGRPIWDAQNTTGIDMPSKGGNPALTDEQLADIVKYIRSLHE